MNDGAELRTDLTEDRTLLANERTFAGWLRTSMAALGLALASHVLGSSSRHGFPERSRHFFLATALLVVWLAERRACVVSRRLEAHRIVAARLVNLRLIAVVVSLGTIALGAAIWLVPFL